MDEISSLAKSLMVLDDKLASCMKCGFCQAFCPVFDTTGKEGDVTRGKIALVENLQRRDLDFIEEALGISQLIRMFGMSQEEAARRLGKSQPSVANKLRLLRLPKDVLDTLRDEGMTERHGRALTRMVRSTLRKLLEVDGIRRIQTMAAAHRGAACRWYVKGLGMHAEGVRRAFYPDGTDAAEFAAVKGD